MIEFLIGHLDMLMFLAAILLLLRGFPVAFTLAGIGILFALLGVLFEEGNFATGDLGFLRFYYNRIFGLMDESNEVLVAVPLFIFMGVMLERSQVAGELLATMGKLFGNLQGGLGLSVVFVGMLLAASTGIVGATVVTMGLISLPTMLRYSYDKGLACGSIAASGTLGQIIPPSIVLVILGDVISSEYQTARQQINTERQQEAWAQGDYSFVPDAIDPVSVGDLFAGALIPGLMLVGLYMAYLIFTAISQPQKVPAIFVPLEDRVGPLQVVRVLIPPIFLIIAVLGSILAGIATPTEAAAVGAVGAILLAGERFDETRPWPMVLAVFSIVAVLVVTANFDLRLTKGEFTASETYAFWVSVALLVIAAWGIGVSLWRCFSKVDETTGRSVLGDVMQSTTKVTCMVFVILIGAQLFNLTFRGLGGEDTVHEVLSGIPGGATGAMLAVMVLMFVLGFFLDFLEIVFVVIPLTAPTLFLLGLDPVWVAIMMAINLQTSFLTPPFGFALFYLRGVAPPEVRTIDIYRGVVPFVLIQILALAIIWFVPSIATWLPAALFD
ncbi:MAG: TRAP transporter large permease subunit [Pseudomonadota bacterium]